MAAGRGSGSSVAGSPVARSIGHRKYNQSCPVRQLGGQRADCHADYEVRRPAGLAGEHGVDALMRNRVTRDTVVKLLWRAQLAEVQPIKGAWHSCEIRRWLIRATVKVDQE